MRNQEITSTSSASENAEPRALKKSRSSIGNQMRKLARSFSEAGGRLGTIFRAGKDTEPLPAYHRFAGPSIELPCKHVEQLLLKDNVLSETEQARLANCLLEQASSLTETNPDLLFKVNEDYLIHAMVAKELYKVNLPAAAQPKAVATSLQSASFIEPQHAAQLVLADLYKAKYDIQLFVQQRAESEPAKLAGLLLGKLRGSNGAPVGVVLKWPKGEIGVGGVRVSPLLIQQTAEGLDLINLDNTSGLNSSLQDALKHLHASGIQIRHLKVHTPGSRALAHTQDTEALQLLKDALVEHKRIGGNLGEHYWSEYGNDASAKMAHVAGSPFFIDMPPHLRKTAQTDKALHSTRVLPDETNLTKAPSANPSKQQTIGEHRLRFSVAVEGNQQANHFLTVKSYKNAYRVLEQLKSLPDPTARQQYIDTLQTRYGI